MIFVLAVASVSAENPMLIKVDLVEEHDIIGLRGLALDIPYVTDKFAEVVAYRKDLPRFDDAGLTYRIIHEDMVSFYQSRNPLNLDMGGFPTFLEIMEAMDYLYNTYPQFVSARWSIGLSVEGRDLWVFKISDNVGSDEDEPEVFYNALTHAREPASATWLLYFAEWLCQNYGSNSTATDIVNNRELFFLPVFNPDGYEYNRQTNPDGSGMWRKNRRDNGDGTFGVDLNRNWGHMWGYDDNGSSPDPGDDLYRGTAPFSEPETQVVRDFIISRNFSFIVNGHTYGNQWLYPWGYDFIYTSDHDLFRMIGDSVTILTGYVHGTPWELLHNRWTNGAADDWMYGERTEKPLILSSAPETGGNFDGFWPAPSRIPELNEEMLPIGIYMAQIAGDFRGLAFEYPDGIPEHVAISQPTTFEVLVTGVRGGEAVPGSGRLHYSIDGGPLVSMDMNELESNHYEASLPLMECGSIVDFYLTADETLFGTFSDPGDAPAETYSAFPVTSIVVAWDDDFETDRGWVVSGNAFGGQWERGVPAGGGDRGDPGSDYDGSGNCYLTDNAEGDSDVDGGYTYLMSPTIDLSGVEKACIHYALWYSNNSGDDPNNDLFKTFVSNNNGANWILVETIGPRTSVGWTEHSFSITDLVAPTDQIRFLFEVSDLGGESVVEAGIDAVIIKAFECNPADIPTLTEWGMIILGLLLLAGSTAAVIRKRKLGCLNH